MAVNILIVFKEMQFTFLIVITGEKLDFPCTLLDSKGGGGSEQDFLHHLPNLLQREQCDENLTSFG